MTKSDNWPTAAFRLARWALCFVAAGAAAAGAAPYTVLESGEEARGIVEVGYADYSRVTYAIDVPDGAMAVNIRITEAAADLDLYLRYEEPMADSSEADFLSETDSWTENLELLKIYESWMPSGRYYLDVSYGWDELPRRNGEVFSEIPFAAVWDYLDAGDITQTLEFGPAVKGELSAESNYLAHFTLNVPPGSEALRIDVLETPGDIDLYLSRKNPSPSREEYLSIVETDLGRESLVFRPAAGLLNPGTYHLTAAESAAPGYPVPFSLQATLGTAPPQSAPPPPPLLAGNGAESMNLITVQLISEAGIGSGCLVSEDGLIVTNNHVAVDEGGKKLPRIVVAVALDPFDAPQELFEAQVIRTNPEDDLALIRIVSDRWGRPLPTDYRFPYWQLGDPEALKPGDELLFLGFPWMGTGLSRSHFTVTRGILAGGERTDRGLTLKSDAIIGGGSSGGAVTDRTRRLLGFPTFTTSGDTVQLSYFVPVTRIPADWIRMLPAD